MTEPSEVRRITRARAGSAEPSWHEHLAQLQRSAGNQAAAQLVRRAQAKQVRTQRSKVKDPVTKKAPAKQSQARRAARKASQPRSLIAIRTAVVKGRDGLQVARITSTFVAKAEPDPLHADWEDTQKVTFSRFIVASKVIVKPGTSLPTQIHTDFFGEMTASKTIAGTAPFGLIPDAFGTSPRIAGNIAVFQGSVTNTPTMSPHNFPTIPQDAFCWTGKYDLDRLDFQIQTRAVWSNGYTVTAKWKRARLQLDD